MKTLEQVIQNKFLLSKNYKRVYDFIYPLDLTLDELTTFIIYNMECENIIEFIRLVTPFICYTVKPCYFESRSYENPGFFQLYPKSRQKLNFIAPKIVPLYRVSKIRKFEHEGQSRASDNLLNLIV